MNAFSSSNFMQSIHRQRGEAMVGARRRHGLPGWRPTPAPVGDLLPFPVRPGPSGDGGHASAHVA